MVRIVYFVSLSDTTICFGNGSSARRESVLSPCNTEGPRFEHAQIPLYRQSVRISLSKKEHRNAEARKTCCPACPAGSHCRVSKRLAPHALLNVFRQFAQVRRFKSHDRLRSRSGCELIRLARFARFLSRIVHAPSAFGEQRGHFFFLFFHAEVRNGKCKILNREEAPGPSHRRYSHGSETWIENIFAVAGGTHPSRVDGMRVRADGDVLGDHAEPGTGLREAIGKVGLAGELVLEHIQVGHTEGVLVGGLKECFVPLEKRERLRNAFVVKRLEELALGIVHRQRL
jgi:hypothetical protein